MKKILNLATVFSGIGAIEQALERLKIDYNIVFACDNGEIEIDIDTDKELKNIKKMSTVDEKIIYANSFYVNSKKTNYVEKTYMNNYDRRIQANRFFYDVKMLDGRDFKNKVDLFVGGSPCQSFSIAGTRGGLEDTRGTEIVKKK